MSGDRILSRSNVREVVLGSGVTSPVRPLLTYGLMSRRRTALSLTVFRRNKCNSKLISKVRARRLSGAPPLAVTLPFQGHRAELWTRPVGPPAVGDGVGAVTAAVVAAVLLLLLLLCC